MEFNNGQQLLLLAVLFIVYFLMHQETDFVTEQCYLFETADRLLGVLCKLKEKHIFKMINART